MKISRLHKHLPQRSLIISAAILLTISFFTAWFFGSKPSVGQQQKILQHYIANQQEDAGKLLSDTALIRKLLLRTPSPQELDETIKRNNGLFLFTNDNTGKHQLVFWNNQKIIPPQPDLSLPDGTYFQQQLNGYYIVIKQKITLSGINQNLWGYVLIPVLNKFYLETENSLTQFAHSTEAIKRIAIAVEATQFPIRSLDGKPLFYVKQASYNGKDYAEPVTMVLRIASLLLLLVYLHLFVETVNKKRGPVNAIIFLAGLLIVCRLVLFFFPSLFSLRQLTLFDPSIFASNFINRSLGDLLISALFLCWIVLFAWNNLGPIKHLPSFLKGRRILLAGIAGIFLLIFTTFQLANIIYELVANSKISFNVINFFSLDIYTVFGFIVLALLSLTYYYFSRLLFRFILLAFPSLVHLYMGVAVVGLLFLTLRTGDAIVLFYLPVLLWLMFYTLLLSQEQLIINRFRITIAGMLFWIFIFSISLAILILQGNKEVEWRERRAMAEKYDQLSDPSKERTLRYVLASLDNRFLYNNFSKFYTEPENRRIRDSIINTNYLGYDNPYNTSFYVFDSLNNPVNNDDPRTYAELSNILDIQSKPTGIPELFYYETSFDQFVYITKRPIIFDSTRLIGTLFIVAAPKQFQNTDDLYPNLFNRANKNDLENSPLYSYAIYKDRNLLNHSSKYSFPTKLDSLTTLTNEISKVENGEYDELWYKASSKKFIVIAKKKDSLIESITLFSYLLCAFLFMVGILRLSSFLVQLAGDRKQLNIFSFVNIRTQIHGTIIFISVLSFLIIGVATISFFVVRYNRNNIDRLRLTANGIVKELEKNVRDTASLANSTINFSDSSSLATWGSVIKDISAVHGVIVNLYDLSGTMHITSDEIIYKKGVLSNKMHPAAFYHLDTRKEVQRVQHEEANDLEYLSIYTAIRDEKGGTYAYLNIPSFTSQIELNQEISNFLVTIINLNAFIFLIAGIIALFITNRISRSFSIIGDKMKEITLGRAAEEIVWTKNDEIGELVKQYNRMVHQLEQSAEALAKSEREGAWREMARQVAHEIKNPLTPMKLSIQYLQKAIQNRQPNVQQLTTNVATTLIEQIDHLSKIAGDFSQFANIGNKKLEKMDLHAVLSSLVDLYSANPKMELRWKKLPGELIMRTDKTHMNRLFTNLLSNAVDACSERRQCVVTISEELKDGFVIVSVHDNGEGIPAHTQTKIFTPNFTTKTSGTGLGLAMCKSIAEQSGGSIWFKTAEGEGTTFFVQLPLSE